MRRGKSVAEYTPSMDMGGFVIVINADKVKVTGNKESQKMYYRHSGRPGSLKSETFTELQAVWSYILQRLAANLLMFCSLLVSRQRAWIVRSIRAFNEFCVSCALELLGDSLCVPRNRILTIVHRHMQAAGHQRMACHASQS